MRGIHSFARLARVIFLVVWPGLAMADDGWKTILDGKSFQGWNPIGLGRAIRVDADGICLGNGGGLAFAGESLKDFELRAQLKTIGDANSGIFLHTDPTGFDPKKHWEVQIANTTDADKSLYTGAIWLITERSRPPVRDKAWFELSIRVEGTRIVTAVDGKQIEDVDTAGRPGLQRLNGGYIAFQAPRKEESELWIRKVEIRTAAAAKPPQPAPAAPSVTMLPKTSVPSIPEVVSLKGKMDEAWRARVTAPYLSALTRTVPEYIVAIDTLGGSLQKEGKLDDLIALRAERQRAEDLLKAVVQPPSNLEPGREPELPSLPPGTEGPVRNLRTAWDDKVKAAVATKSSNSEELRRIYVDALQKMEADLTKQGRMDDAIAVRHYREGL